MTEIVLSKAQMERAIQDFMFHEANVADLLRIGRRAVARLQQLGDEPAKKKLLDTAVEQLTAGRPPKPERPVRAAKPDTEQHDW